MLHYRVKHTFVVNRLIDEFRIFESQQWGLKQLKTPSNVFKIFKVFKMKRLLKPSPSVQLLTIQNSSYIHSYMPRKIPNIKGHEIQKGER